MTNEVKEIYNYIENLKGMYWLQMTNAADKEEYTKVKHKFNTTILLEEFIKGMEKKQMQETKKQVEYELLLKVKIAHDFEGIENLKDNNEFSIDLANVINSEAMQSGATFCNVEVIESKIDVH